MSQADLAKALDITQGAVGLWEQGRSLPEIDKLPGLSDLIGTSLEELLGASSTRTSGDGSLLDAALVAEARDMGVDVVTELNARLRELIGKARRERWLKENREALEDANAFLARHGLWSDGKRQF
jgi:antitoxin CcdA